MFIGDIVKVWTSDGDRVGRLKQIRHSPLGVRGSIEIDDGFGPYMVDAYMDNIMPHKQNDPRSSMFKIDDKVMVDDEKLGDRNIGIIALLWPPSITGFQRVRVSFADVFGNCELRDYYTEDLTLVDEKQRKTPLPLPG